HRKAVLYRKFPASSPDRGATSDYARVASWLCYVTPVVLRNSKVVLDEIKPIAERLGADDRFTGRGVTIAFLDAGFHAHSDLTKPKNRVKAFHDVLSREPAPHHLGDPDGSSWHGMMTSVVACGNGERSHGRYKGLAHEAELVFVKVGSVSRIRHDDL